MSIALFDSSVHEQPANARWGWAADAYWARLIVDLPPRVRELAEEYRAAALAGAPTQEGERDYCPDRSGVHPRDFAKTAWEEFRQRHRRVVLRNRYDATPPIKDDDLSPVGELLARLHDPDVAAAVADILMSLLARQIGELFAALMQGGR